MSNGGGAVEAVLPGDGSGNVGIAWPTLIGGQWVPICEQRAGRQSLLVCLADGWCVLSPSTAAPIVLTSQYGAIPAGMFLGADVGNGPGVFRLSAATDGCVTEQEWFAWLAPPTAVPFTPVWGGFDLLLMSNDITGNIDGQMTVMWTQSASTGPLPIVVTSSVLGVLVPIWTSTIVDPSLTGDQSQVDLYVYLSPPGETITASGTVAATQILAIISLLGSGIDTTGTATGTAAAITVATAGVPQAVGEWAVAVANVGDTDGTQQSASGNLVGFVQFQSPVLSPNGVPWLVMSAVGQVAAPGTAAVVTLTAALAPLAGNIAFIAAVLAPASVDTSTQIAVIESFTLPPLPDPPVPTFAASLPTLDAAGYAALQSLLAKVTAAQQPLTVEPPNA